MKCDGCGIESVREDFFRSVPRSFRRGTRSLCPICYQRRDYIVLQYAFCAPVVLGVIGLALLLCVPSTTFGPVLVNIALAQVFAYFAIVFHEAGHALGAVFAGIRPFVIEIGSGKIVRLFRFCGLLWKFRATPAGGCAHGAPLSAGWYRTRATVFILGGPAANILLILLGLQCIPQERSLDFGFSQGINPASMLVLMNAATVLFSLWPYEMDSSYGKIPNDMLLLWRTWKLPKEFRQQVPAFYHYYQSETCRMQGQHDQAKEWLDRGRAKYPAQYTLELAAGINLLDLKRYAEARGHYIELLKRWSKHPELRAILFNNIAWATIHSGEKELTWQADACSRIALEQLPWLPAIQGTRGAVLLAQGMAKEAIPLLLDALNKADEPDIRATVACKLAKAYAAENRKTEAGEMLAIARRLDPNCPFLAVAEVTVDAPASS